MQLSFVVLSFSSPCERSEGRSWAGGGPELEGGNVGETEQVLLPLHSLWSPSLPASLRRGSQGSAERIRALDQTEERPFSLSVRQ